MEVTMPYKGRPFFKCVGSTYMGTAQIALDPLPPPPLSNRQTQKKVPQTILASPSLTFYIDHKLSENV